MCTEEANQRCGRIFGMDTRWGLEAQVDRQCLPQVLPCQGICV